MNNLEQRIRDLPRPVPTRGLDERIAALLSPAVRDGPSPTSRRPSLMALTATAVAAGLAGFAAGIGTGHWMTAPPAEQTLAGPPVERRERAVENETTTLVRLTDSRVSAGLDFSQSLEPFHVHPIDREGS